MAMREECKNFQSRTYASGETARYCTIDLAPEAPWKCPSDCPGFQPRMADVAWVHGSLISPPAEEAPKTAALPETQSMLQEAEQIVSASFPEAALEVRHKRRRGLFGWRKDF